MTFRHAVLVFLAVVGSVATASAQIAFKGGHPDELRTTAELPKTAQVVRVPADLVVRLAAGPAPRITLPTPTGPLTLVTERFSLFEPDAPFIRHDADGEHLEPIPDHVLLRGRVEGKAGSTVFLAAFSTHIVAMIETVEPEGKRRFLVSPDTIMDGRFATHIVHEVVPGQGTPAQCHSEELSGYQRSVDSIFAVTAVDALRQKSVERDQRNVPYALQLALDCTFSLYRNLGNNLGVTATSAIAIAGACAVVYERDANVLIRVPYLRVWTVADPYPGDIGSKLGKIREHWEANMRHVRRSVTCLLSGEGGGGLAWVGVLCGGYGYNVSGVDGRVNFPASGYIWDVDVTSHELGHNIGSSHTHNCGWNPPLDSCWNAEGGCYENTRVQRGTIMSYCHLQWKGTELQFHPRVASLFRRVMERTACVATVPNESDSDVAVVHIVVPANGGQVTAGRSFAPEAQVRNVGKVALANVRLRFRATDFDDAEFATTTVTLPSLAPGQTTRVRFPNVTLTSAGDYLAVVALDAPTDQHATNDILTRPFRVAPPETGTINIVSPNGGESLLAGSTVNVKVTTTGVTRLNVQYSVDNGATWATLRYITDANGADIPWVVPYIPSTTCLVRAASITDPSVADVSNAVFTIRVPKDVEALDILTPAVNTTVPTPLAPVIVVRNNGDELVRDVNVRLTMRWVRSTGFSFDTTFTLSELRARQTDTITLAPTALLANGVHVMTLTVAADGDSNRANDRFGREFTAEGLTPPSDVRYEEGPQRVLLQWQVRAASDDARVEIWRSLADGAFERIRSVRSTVTSYVDEGLINDTTYAYQLRIVDGAQRSVFTPTVSARPRRFPAGVRLLAPRVISPADGTQAVNVPAELVWSSVTGGDQYEVQVALDAQFTDPEYVHIVRDPGRILQPLAYNATRRWRVRALNQTFTGPWSASPTFITARSCAGTALTFNGSDTRAVDTSFRWNGGAVTVEYWTFVPRAGLRATTTFMVGASDNTGNRFQAHAPWDDGNLYWDYGNSGTGRISTSFGPYFDRWVHLAFVSDGTGFKAIYINGALAASGNEAAAPSGLRDLTIGAMRDRLWFRGSVDEFRIWNVARTQEEIRATMFRRLPPASDNIRVVGAWRFDEGSGTSAKDAVRNRTLTLSNATMWSQGAAPITCEDVSPLSSPALANTTTPLPRDHTNRFSWSPVTATRGTVWYEAQVVDPASGAVLQQRNNLDVPQVDMPGLPADSAMRLRVRAVSTFTTSPWAERTITTSAPCATAAARFNGADYFTSADFLYSGKAVTVEYWSFVAGDQLSNGTAFSAGERADETRRLQAHAPWSDRSLYWDYGNWREAGRVSTSYEASLGRWTHVALVSNGYDTMAIHLDGRLVRRSSFTDAPNDLRQFAIGANPHQNHFHKGAIRDMRVWNVMRTEDQIRRTMYERITEPRSNLLGAWLLDEGAGTSIQDVTGRTVPATATGTPVWEALEQHIMHAPAVVRGRRDIQRGDTATYRLRVLSGVTAQWSVTGGVLQGAPGADTMSILWNGADSTGELVVVRTWPGGCSDRTTVRVTLHTTLDVTQGPNAVASVAVYPNPAGDVVTIVTADDDVASGATVEFVDLHGRVVLRSLLEHVQTSVDVRALASGAYTVRVTSERGVVTVPLVVRH